MFGSTSGPGRPRSGRSGLLFLALSALLTGCDQLPIPGRSASIELDGGSVQLPSGARLHDIEVGGVPTGAPGRPAVEGGPRDAVLDPSGVRARPGDALRFTVIDALTHAIAFDTASAAPEQRRFLAATSQVASPPLVGEGVAWVVSLQGAPPGRYSLRCLAHGERGVLEVVAPRR